MVDHWLYIVGMHRSGTSAVTGAISELGFQLPRDNIVGMSDNPAHNESRVLMKLNEQLLNALGGAWHAPPTEAVIATEQDLLHGKKRRARYAAAYAFPNLTPAIYKDPRLCLLLPFWRETLGGEDAGVLIWRSPFEVASSLHRRNGLLFELGLALWEYYNRFALISLRGMPTMVVRYEEILEFPDKFREETERFGSILRWNIKERLSENSPVFKVGTRNRQQERYTEGLSKTQLDLFDLLNSIGGTHESFVAPDVSERWSWSEAILELNRELEQKYAFYASRPIRAGLRAIPSAARKAKRVVEPYRWRLASRLNNQ